MLTLFYNSTLDIYGTPNDNRRDFLIKAQQKAREARDAEIDAAATKYDNELEKMERKLSKEQRGLTYDNEMFGARKQENLYTTGEAVISLAKGRTNRTLSRMSRANRFQTKAKERSVEAGYTIADLEDQIDAKQVELQRSLKEINDKWAKIAMTVEEVKLNPYKKDITSEMFGIGWLANWYMVLNGHPVILPAFAASGK